MFVKAILQIYSFFLTIKTMKRLFVLFFVVAVVGIAALIYQPILKQYLYYSPCDTPIHYTIGPVDERFSISVGEFTQDITQAVSVWDSAINKQLFVYDPKASLIIGM